MSKNWKQPPGERREKGTFHAGVSQASRQAGRAAGQAAWQVKPGVSDLPPGRAQPQIKQCLTSAHRSMAQFETFCAPVKKDTKGPKLKSRVAVVTGEPCSYFVASCRHDGRPRRLAGPPASWQAPTSAVHPSPARLGPTVVPQGPAAQSAAALCGSYCWRALQSLHPSGGRSRSNS